MDARVPAPQADPEPPQDGQNQLISAMAILSGQISSFAQVFGQATQTRRRRTPSSESDSDVFASTTPSGSIELPSAEESEGEVEEVVTEDMLRSFHKEAADVANLITAIRAALKLEDAFGAKPKKAMFGSGKPRKITHYFPCPDELNDRVKEQWANLKKSFPIPRIFKIRYPFQEEVESKWVNPPSVDPTICRLNKATCIQIGRAHV